MTIKEIETLSGMNWENIRFYEQEGLITPDRMDNGNRNYSEAELQILLRIKLLTRDSGSSNYTFVGEELPRRLYPWRRFLARMLDFVFYSMLWLIFLIFAFHVDLTTRSNLEIIIAGFISIFIMLILEPLLQRLFSIIGIKWGYKMKKFLVIVSVSLVFVSSIYFLQVYNTHKYNKFNETYDYLVSRIIVTEKEKSFFEDLDELIEHGEGSDYANDKKSEFVKLFNERHHSSEPVDSIEMYLKEDGLIFCIQDMGNKYNKTIEFAYEYKLNGEFTKVATFVWDNYYYTVRNNSNDHIIKLHARDSLFNIREEYVHDIKGD